MVSPTNACKRISSKAYMACIFIMVLLLTGCMYPDELRKENQVAPGEYIPVVQQAVDRYIEANSVPPIKNSEIDTPIFEKYVVDFKKLMDSGYLSQLPLDSFESGGSYYYVLIHIEEQPTVKLLDLVVKQQVGDVQRAVEQYSLAHNGQLPLGDEAGEGYFRIQYDQLGIQAVQIRSPYSRQFLSLLLHESGKVYIDYAPDLMRVKEQAGETFSAEQYPDLRYLLTEVHHVVPVSSAPYVWSDGQPRVRTN